MAGDCSRPLCARNDGIVEGWLRTGQAPYLAYLDKGLTL
jgi:hypothetical protein